MTKVLNGITIEAQGQHFCCYTTRDNDWDIYQWLFAFCCALRAAGFAEESINEIFKFRSVDDVTEKFIMGS